MEGKQETAGEPVIIDVQCATVCKQTVNNSKQGLEEDCLMMLAQGADDDWDQQNSSLTFDEALTKHVGEFGRGQILYYVAGSLLWVPNAVLILLLVFALGSPIADKAWACRDPTDSICSSLLENPDAAAVQAGFCAMQPSQWHWTGDPAAKLVSRFGLVCGDAWKAQVANSFFFVGYFIGSGLFGVLSDKYGRKVSAFGASLLAAVFTAAAAGASNYWGLLSFRLLTGIGVAGQALGAYLLSTEMIGPTWRGAAGIITQCFFVLGEFALVLIAVAVSSWRGQFAAGAVLCAASLLLWFVVPESGRWLQVQGRTEEAYQALATLARLNGTQPPQEPLAGMTSGTKAPPGLEAGLDSTGSAAPDTQTAPTPQGLGAALRNSHIARRFVILAYSWMVMCMAYYGISFALSSLAGSLVMSFSVAALAELPSYLSAAFAIERCGRHNTMAAGMLLGGIACICCAITPTGPGQTVLGAIGKFGIAGSFAIASIYTSELFPTLIRSAVLGYQNQAARVGGIIAPFIVMASATSGAGSLIPFLTFGAAAVVAGLLICTLPETLGVPLPDTMQDMDNIASVFTHKTWRTGGLAAATKSMFKTHVNFTKPARPAKTAFLMPAVQEGTCTSPATSAAPSPVPAGHQTCPMAQVSPPTSSNSQQALLLDASHGSSAPPV